MHAHNLRKHLVRAVAPPKFAAAVLVTLALLSSACSNDAASRITSPPLLSSSTKGPPAGASSFTVLAHTAVSCSGGSITGDVGTFQAPGDIPAGVVTQTTGCLINGTVHVGDAAAKAAFRSFLDSYAALAPKTGDVCPIITGTLDGKNLTPGVYCVSSEAKTGTLTLTGPPNGTWVIKVPSGALTGTNFHVVMAGQGQACNVTWWVDAAATMTTSAFQGNILAGAAISMSAGTLNGNAWAGASGVGDVTFTESTVVTGCEGGTGGGHGGPPSCTERGDRVTGGGWITGKFGGKANFAVSGGNDSRKNAFQGHLEYDDKGVKGKSDDIKVQGTGVTAYSVLDDVTRRIDGTAKVNGKAGFTYQVVVSDNGEPGRGKHGDGNDQFAISIFNASGTLIYSASGTLGGGNIQLHEGRGCDKDGHDEDLSKGWKVYNIDAATSKWDIDKAPAFAGGVAQFPFDRFVSTASGSFAVYLLNNVNFDISGKTISANVAWDQGTFLTRGQDDPTAYVRLEFQDVGNGDFVSNDYWWSSVKLDLNAGTSGTLTSALTDRTLWTNICGQSATDVVAHPGTNCTGGIDPATSPYDGFTNAMKNVKLVGFSFGRASRFASGVAVVGGPASFRLNSFTITP